MGLFKKSHKIPGWLAIGLQEDGLCAVHIKRVLSSMPKVELASFYPAVDTPGAAQLEKFGKDLHADRYSCSTFLSSGQYQILSVDAPNVPPDELKAAIRWRLKDMLDFHVDDATIDVMDIPVEKNMPVRAHSMYAVAARNQIIGQRQALFAEAKIPLGVIDIPEIAQRNISVLMEPESRGLALLAFDSDGGLLTVTFAGELYLSRRIDVSLAQLLQSDAGQQEGLFGRITLEVQRSLDHFDRQFHFITLSKLVVFPAGELGSALHGYLKGNLDVPVEVLNLESVLDLSKVPELKPAENQARYFKALGAALRHEEKAL